jgi:uncharacterized membrane protein
MSTASDRRDPSNHGRIIDLKSIAILSGVTAIVFLAADAFMIPLVMRPLFLSRLGPQMLDDLRLFPAALFYIIHVAGLVVLAGAPALRIRDAGSAAIKGAMVGLVAYGCYEMTSWTIMRNWDATLVVVDLIWGVFISGFAVWAGTTVAIKLSAA